jgi:undecaprenyl-diphosphatase
MDKYLFDFINQFAGRYVIADIIGIFLAVYLGYLLIFLLLFFTLLNLKRRWTMLLGALFSGFLAKFVIVQGIRMIAPVNRPFVEDAVTQLIEHSPTASFPSGHVSFFFAISFFLLFWLRGLKEPSACWKAAVVFFFSTSFLIGLGRVFCGLHWVSDILAGAAVGLVSGWLVYKAFQAHRFLRVDSAEATVEAGNRQ